MALTDMQVRRIKPNAKPTKISDGGGLHLLVTPGGSKLWRLAYRFAGKQKTLAIGAYPEVTLEKARLARVAAKEHLSEGTDPGEARKREKRHTVQAAQNTYQVVADEWLDKIAREGRAPATLLKTEWLLSLALPTLGHRPITSISSAEVLDVLRRVEGRGRLETARRLRSTLGCVFRYAIATARAENDPTFALRGALVAPQVTHRAALTDPKRFGGLLRAIEDLDGQPTTRIALQLLALLFPRPGELRLAEWSEIDWDGRIWRLPPHRTKMRREHRVPLTAAAITLLTDLHSLTGDSRLLFPSLRAYDRPIAENTLNAALRRMGYSKDEMTSHGFRATASTLLNESGKWSSDVIERQLAHTERNAVRRAYSRGDYWADRVRMMAWWSDYLDQLRLCV